MAFISDHAMGLAFSVYLAVADNLVRGVIRPLLREGENREHLIDIACDWGFRTAAFGLAIELIFAFRRMEGDIGWVGFLAAIAGFVLLLSSAGIPVGEIFDRRVGPRWLAIRPTLGRILQLWLLACAILLVIASVVESLSIVGQHARTS